MGYLTHCRLNPDVLLLAGLNQSLGFLHIFKVFSLQHAVLSLLLYRFKIVDNLISETSLLVSVYAKLIRHLLDHLG